MRATHYRILCVEDDEDTCELLKFILRHANPDHDVQTAESGAETLQLIASEKFDLYVLDYRLSDMFGIELCWKIRRKDKTTPIMFFTAEARESVQRIAKSAGADAYLVKPNDVDILTNTVNKLLQTDTSSINNEAAA